MNPPPRGRLGPLSYLIFSSRWLQLPLYLGLIVAQAIYVVQFLRELWHLIDTSLFGHMDMTSGESAEATIMLTVLGLIDVVMISNLLVMVIVGGYETFVSRLKLDGHPDQPEWLSHVNATVLKVKLAMAIIGISSIHLLATFIKAKAMDGQVIMWQILLHLTFVVSALALAWMDRIMGPAEEHAGET
ncbi:TIGR00645 family protein [Dyella sp.]|uniref:TIGR00645 family protein n=1 Tax=Dyella sp. TaxID=1869338 RepID=UPI002ED011C0